jgi:hypothetical protein
MATMLKRLFWLALLGGAGFAVWGMLQRKNAGPPPAGPEWPPLDPNDTADKTDGAAAASRFADVGADTAATDAPPESAPGDDAEAAAAPSDERSGDGWIPPIDGACPVSHPIKANDNSGIFHLPGGRFYDRTGAERCYARAEDAEADGYRAAKS